MTNILNILIKGLLGERKKLGKYQGNKKKKNWNCIEAILNFQHFFYFIFFLKKKSNFWEEKKNESFATKFPEKNFYFYNPNVIIYGQIF